MASVRTIASLLLGALLYYWVVVYIGGYLAAIAVPKQYFDHFGREHIGAALALMYLGTINLPINLMVAAGTVTGLRLIGGSWRVTSIGVFVGMLTCYLYWVYVSVSFMIDEPNSQRSFLSALAQIFSGRWYSLPNLLAPWLGLAVGIWLYKLWSQSPQRAEA
jgi:hypothetical protein